MRACVRALGVPVCRQSRRTRAPACTCPCTRRPLRGPADRRQDQLHGRGVWGGAGEGQGAGGHGGDVGDGDDEVNECKPEKGSVDAWLARVPRKPPRLGCGRYSRPLPLAWLQVAAATGSMAAPPASTSRSLLQMWKNTEIEPGSAAASQLGSRRESSNGSVRPPQLKRPDEAGNKQPSDEGRLVKELSSHALTAQLQVRWPRACGRSGTQLPAVSTLQWTRPGAVPQYVSSAGHWHNSMGPARGEAHMCRPLTCPGCPCAGRRQGARGPEGHGPGAAAAAGGPPQPLPPGEPDGEPAGHPGEPAGQRVQARDPILLSGEQLRWRGAQGGWWAQQPARGPCAQRCVVPDARSTCMAWHGAALPMLLLAPGGEPHMLTLLLTPTCTQAALARAGCVPSRRTARCRRTAMTWTRWLTPRAARAT